MGSIEYLSKMKSSKNNSDMILLPKLKESLNSYTEKEVGMIDKQNKVMKKELDNIVYIK